MMISVESLGIEKEGVERLVNELIN